MLKRYRKDTLKTLLLLQGQRHKTILKTFLSYTSQVFSFLKAHKKKLIGFILTPLSLYVLLKPNVSITDDKVLDPLDPFQTTFTICNDSNFEIKDITYTFKADIELMNGSMLRNTESFNNNRNEPYHQDNNYIDSIGSGECSTINSTGYSMSSIKTAILKIDYSYSYFSLKFKNNTETFKAKKDVFGKYHWSKYIN